MIYPTRRAIYLLLAGAPVALALGLIRPELWLVAPGWIAVILACLILDCVAGANPRHLALDARFPHQIGVGDPFDLSLTASGRALAPEPATAMDNAPPNAAAHHRRVERRERLTGLRLSGF